MSISLAQGPHLLAPEAPPAHTLVLLPSLQLLQLWGNDFLLTNTHRLWSSNSFYLFIVCLFNV